MGRALGDVHTATGEFDEEQYVQTTQPDRVDREEIHRDHTRRLCPQELAPGGTPPVLFQFSADLTLTPLADRS
jgi:hypothetical protein